MTTQTVEAIYEHGTFRIVQPATVVLHEGQRVRLIVESEFSAGNILALATSVYDGMAETEITEVEQIARRRAS
jgi:predicted DNA-binding antitoxin AbrB/MazE fold protein